MGLRWRRMRNAPAAGGNRPARVRWHRAEVAARADGGRRPDAPGARAVLCRRPFPGAADHRHADRRGRCRDHFIRTRAVRVSRRGSRGGRPSRLGRRIPDRRHRARGGGRHACKAWFPIASTPGRFTVHLLTHRLHSPLPNHLHESGDGLCQDGSQPEPVRSRSTRGARQAPLEHPRHHRHHRDLGWGMTYFPARRLRALSRRAESRRGQSRTVLEALTAAVTVRSHLATTAAYGHELVEPFITNPRALAFPVSRTWTRAGGGGPAGIA